jgi:hypothetical protein
MKDLNILTAEKILGIKSPENLFVASSEEDIKKIYRKLSTLWHPDKHINDNKDTSSVFAHIQNLYEKAIVKINSGLWNKGNILLVQDNNGKHFEIQYLIKNTFEFGISYIGKSIVVWEFRIEDESFFNRAVNNLEKINFANDKMKEEINKYLPTINKVIRTKDSILLILNKDKDSISLREVLKFYNGFIDPKHVAWILSGMYNLACFNQYNKTMQAGFSLDNYFINPKEHTGELIGGWWFSQQIGEKLIALSTEAVNVAPIQMLNKKISDINLDLELIKLIGRQLLGDYSGIKLKKDNRIPKPLLDWLNDCSKNKPFEAYDLWQNKVLKESFGVRRFTKMDLTVNDIYN